MAARYDPAAHYELQVFDLATLLHEAVERNRTSSSATS